MKIKENFGSSSVCGLVQQRIKWRSLSFSKTYKNCLSTNNVDHCTRLCHASSVAALMECLVLAVSAPFTAVKDADCMIVIGARPTTTSSRCNLFQKSS